MTSLRRHNRCTLLALSALPLVVLPAAAQHLIAVGPSNSRSNICISGQDGYHTYRIPALAVSTRGAILCLYEGGNRHPYEWLRLARFHLPWLRQREVAE
jgi:hypothetical protein